MEMSGQLQALATLPLGKVSDDYWLGIWVGSWIKLDIMLKRKNPWPYLEMECKSNPQWGHYTDCDIGN
jgi:hypothetical protein